MSDWLQALLLGLLQGLTEFLPVSSSGHLVLFQAWLGEDFFASGNEILFDLVLHVGTLLPVLWFYRADLAAILRSPSQAPTIADAGGLLPWLRQDPDRWLATLVVLGTIPTGLMGIFFEDLFEQLFQSVVPVACALLVTAGLLTATRFAPDRPPAAIPAWAALLLGVAQGLAITPGISRSGTTIAVALFLGFQRAQAARFSFLLSIPAILGAVVLKSRHGLDFTGANLGAVAVGFVAAAVSGYGALVLLVALVKRGGLHRFAYYLVPAAVAALAFLR
jgi:undecaprenyl-diphosphatase